jgi:hypothetical protein
LKILEDKKIKGQFDELGNPLYEDGLCSLIDDYQNPEEEEGDEDF